MSTSLPHQHSLEAESLRQALSNASQDEAAAVSAALTAGDHAITAMIPDLIGLLDDDNPLSLAARWALGRLPAQHELSQLLAPQASLDQREHAYAALASHAAQGADLDALARQALSDEISRSQQGRSGLGEQALGLLAILGASDLAELAQHLIASDSYVDRFEVQAMVKAVANDGRDTKRSEAALAPWQEIEALVDLLSPAPEPTEDINEPEAAAPVEDAYMRPDEADIDADIDTYSDDPNTAAAGEDNEQATSDQPEQEVTTIDWEAFLSSDIAAKMEPQDQQVASQFGPMLDQMCQQVTGRGLAQLNGQELAGLILQVLPQALPPQMVQAALSPQAITSLQRLTQWLEASGAAEAGLSEGITIVRQQLQAQVRSTGMLGGPDYSDPDAASEE